MLLAFADQFVPYVWEGSKTHSMREGERWRAGMNVDAYARSRQPKKFSQEGVQIAGMQLMFQGVASHVEPVKIMLPILGLQQPGPLTMLVSGQLLRPDEMEAFLWVDGFRSPGSSATVQATQFWYKRLKKAPFNGQLIHWDAQLRRLNPKFNWPYADVNS